MKIKNFRQILGGLLLLLLAATSNLPVNAQARLGYTPQASIPPQNASSDFDKLVLAWTEPIEPQASPTPSDNSNSQEPADPDKIIYLTFDDGPDPNWTPQILELMQRYHAVGTFFELGRSAATFPEVVRSLAEGGQTLANHSYTHTDFTTLDYGGFYNEVANTNWAIRNALASSAGLSSQVTPCLRPPYGAVNSTVYSYMAQVGYVPAFWTIDTLDWKGIPGDSILNNVKAGLANPNKVVLMHDGGLNRENTVEGLGLVLHELTLEGYSFEAFCTESGEIAFR
ncbi:MAG TPA: polysaccharide deacetylase family protein [Anaerolineaceae bacterium]|nr:polysaccharide deacetylase family protein [Anaerolineaceae bacterium]